ncbi:prosaposin [Drosophila sechellia]|uniref:GM12122 n=1 Tax=Drosophila sechellia TaxID=7238 RepID=B4HZW6_DROSE|nr:prosaposin [Drosophila sechellia]EDW53573.1 GM12122 [Drosophila sechellia]
MERAGLLAVLALCCAFGAFAAGTPLLGSSKCTWGPSYWCGNFSNSKECRATRHCIQTVWETQKVPVDTDSICKICKDMVTQARDQLKSNETEEELKEVFEGSCKLIPIKPIQKECIKVADDFLPELVEALASQMNPDQVCSVAGLCNSARIDEMFKNGIQAGLDGTVQDEDDSSEETELAMQPNQLSCGNCNLLSRLMHSKFAATDRDDMVETMLHMCGSLSSFSDACANIVLTYFNDIYDHVSKHLTTDAVCHVSGVCASKYHQHEEEKQPQEALVALDAGDDIPCELCEQLVKHLRDVLVANTTETEFKQVMEAFCKQSKGFKDECLSIVDQYYHVIYETLVNKLDANGACCMIGICQKNSASSMKDIPIMPLLPVIEPAQVKITIEKLEKHDKKQLGASEPKFSQKEILDMQLPIDHLMGAANPGALVEGGELCTLCEYMLHFIQETLATPSTDDEIKHTVENICAKLPSGVAGQCRNFVEMYGDAVIALLVQGLNPRDVCPLMQMCPKNLPKKDDVEVFIQPASDEQDHPTCPLCLFAVEQAQMKIRDNKSKDNIKKVLNGLCSHLPNEIKEECVDFVNTYSNELIDMLITDFKPQEICVQLKLCPKTTNALSDLGISLEDDVDGEDKSSSEEISFNDIESLEELPPQLAFDSGFTAAPNCLICEELVKTLEKRMGKHPTRDSIKHILEESCDRMRKPVNAKCHKVIDKYGDKIADLLLKEMDPKLICTELGMCILADLYDLEVDEALKYDVIALPHQDNKLSSIKEPPTCVLCEFIMTKLDADLKNKTEQDDIKRAIEAVCNRLPATVRKQCDAFVDGYASAVLKLLSDVPPKQVCQKLQLCFSVAVTDEVVECGVCHGVTQALLPFLREKKEDESEVTALQMTSVGCENLPAKYYKICSEMISIYGNSIKNLAKRPYIDQSHICAEIGKCFDSEKSSLAFARISA